MNVLALNSSPRGGGQSKTEWMLDHLVAGMQSAGAQVEKIDLRKKKINYCIGCFTCWTKTPGQCVHKDDMSAELFAKFIAADLVVYATPLYHFTLNAQMKTFIERTLPILEPFLIKKEDGKTSHPLRHPLPEAVWLSVAGFPELSVFDELSHYVSFIFTEKTPGGDISTRRRNHDGNGREKWCGRTSPRVFNRPARSWWKHEPFRRTTMETIQQPIVTSKEGGFHGLGNLFWKTCIAEGVTPKEFEQKGHDSATRFPGELHGHFQDGVQSRGRGGCPGRHAVSASADLWKGIAILASKTGR